MKEEGVSEKGYLVDCEDSTQTNKLVAAPTDADAFKYVEKGDGTVKISLLINKFLETVVIPQQIDGKTVTGIEPNVFYGCSSLTTVMIPASVKVISEGAFYGCNSLTNVTIPGSVTEIENYAFSDCESLTTITTSAGSYAEEWAKQEGYSVQII